MKLHLFSSGSILTWKHLLIRGYPERVRFSVPIPFYLLDHPAGLFLFDTGQQPPDVPPPEDDNYIPILTDADRAVNILAARGVTPADLTGIILSHHHSDHFDGLADFPGIPCYIRREELRYPAVAAQVAKQDRQWIFPTGDHDLAGDGRILLLPTPGHTAGHQSLLLTPDDLPPILLTADAAYTREALRQTPPPEEAHLPEWRSLDKIKACAANGVRIITGHDPETWPELMREFP